MADEEISNEGRRTKFERWERLGLDVIRADLEATGGLRIVGHACHANYILRENLRQRVRELAIKCRNVGPVLIIYLRRAQITAVA